MLWKCVTSSQQKLSKSGGKISLTSLVLATISMPETIYFQIDYKNKTSHNCLAIKYVKYCTTGAH